MDTLKIMASLLTALVVGVGSIEKPTDNKIDERATVLVAEWPTPQPQTHPVVESEPDPPNSAESDELSKLAKELAADAVKMKEAADEQRELAGGFESYRPKPESSPSLVDEIESRVRVVCREEMSAALAKHMRSFNSSSGGSSGGAVTKAPTQAAPATQANGSSGGTMSQSMPPVANPRMFGERLGREPLKVTIHTFANGQKCPACDRWLAEVAPQLQAMGVTITRIADIRNGSAPVIDACKGRDVCQRFVGYTDASTIMSFLQ